jgi:hypothetical protein
MTHYTYWHTHPNLKREGPDDSVAVIVQGKTCEACRQKEIKATNLRSKFTTGEKQVKVEQTEKAAVSVGKKGMQLAEEFLKIARANEGVVLHSQAAQINPTYPADPCYYARLLGHTIETNRKEKSWKLIKEK